MGRLEETNPKFEGGVGGLRQQERTKKKEERKGKRKKDKEKGHFFRAQTNFFTSPPKASLLDAEV